MNSTLLVLMLGVYLVAWECTANSVSLQLVQKADTEADNDDSETPTSTTEDSSSSDNGEEMNSSKDTTTSTKSNEDNAASTDPTPNSQASSSANNNNKGLSNGSKQNVAKGISVREENTSNPTATTPTDTGKGVTSTASPKVPSTTSKTSQKAESKAVPPQQKGKKTDGILCSSSFFALAALATLAVAAAAPAH